MTPDEQNKRIAEWCGFKDGHYKCEGCGSAVKWDDDSVTSGGHHGGNGCGAKLLRPPNYCQDLNAIHEAESTLNELLSFKYEGELKKVLLRYCCDTKPKERPSLLSGHPIHATAAQRAEALLRTIGRWEDE